MLESQPEEPRPGNSASFCSHHLDLGPCPCVVRGWNLRLGSERNKRKGGPRWRNGGPRGKVLLLRVWLALRSNDFVAEVSVLLWGWPRVARTRGKYQWREGLRHCCFAATLTAPLIPRGGIVGRILGTSGPLIK